MSDSESATCSICSNPPFGAPALEGGRFQAKPVPGGGEKAAMTDYRWQESVVRVGFVNPISESGKIFREKVQAIAPIWSQYANITLSLTRPRGGATAPTSVVTAVNHAIVPAVAGHRCAWSLIPSLWSLSIIG